MNPNLEFPYPFIDKVLISSEEINERVCLLGEQITRDYANSEKLLLLGLLRGSVMFITDLMRKIHRPLTMDFMSISSYSGSDTQRVDSHRFGPQDQHQRLGCHPDRRYRRHRVSPSTPSASCCSTGSRAACASAPCSISPTGTGSRSRSITWASPSRTNSSSATGWISMKKGRNLPYIASVDLEKYRKGRDRQDL